MNKRLVNHLQNLALLALTLSALFLLARMPLFRTSWASQVQTLLTPRPADSGQDHAGGLAEMFPSVHAVITRDSEYGRYSRLYVTAGDPLLQQLTPLLQEALGSATEAGAAAEQTLRTGLDTPGIYLDLTAELPLAAAAAWLGESASFDRNVRGIALTTELEDRAVLYLRAEEGVYRYYTALTASAVRTFCEGFAPNGGSFAYETNYAPLAPYTVLVAETDPLPVLQADLPAGCTAYNLLTALDFNAHTLSRYTDSSGAEVVEESPRTLRISPDGGVAYFTRGAAASSLYRVNAEEPGIPEALSAAWRLAEALTDGTGASPLYLRAAEKTEEGYTIRFGYRAEGIPVFFSDEGDALTVTIQGNAITAFSYRCRVYTPAEEGAPLLPSSMAQALASLYPGAGLSVGYVDNGPGLLPAGWLPR